MSCSGEEKISIDTSKKLHQAPKQLNGANVEDLNFQCYGGMYSQLLYGQDFEENIDVDFLNLPDKVSNPKSVIGPLRTVSMIVVDETGKPYLTLQCRRLPVLPIGYKNTPPYEVDSKDPHLLVNISGEKVLKPLESFAADTQKMILERVNGDKQISRYWREVNSGTAKGVYRLSTSNTYNGRRDQKIRFESGSGEVGIENSGLLRMGINLQEGKNYEGVLRIKNPEACDLYVALLNSDGTEKLAEKSIKLKASSGSFQKVDFELVPSKSDTKGRFAVLLKKPGEITLGYAFLQPGTWGRVAGGYPVRQDFIDRLKENGISIIRYNGSMNNRCIDSMLYRWQNMIGPNDQRLPYTGTFTPYATHGFGIFEFLMVAEAANLDGVVGISKDEDPAQIKNMIEYAKGPVTSKWGAIRARDGHPDPLPLKFIEISNEQRATGSQAKSYFEKFRGLAAEIWKADPEMKLMVSINIGNTFANLKPGDNSDPSYNQLRDFITWIKEQGKEEQFGWDSHYNASIRPDTIIYNSFGLALQDLLKADLGFNLKLFPLEENGQYHTFERGLVHARLQNYLNRWGDRIEGAATANMFQPEAGYMTWPQGRVFYDSYRFWNQASGHVDQMFTKEWLPWVLDVPNPPASDSLDILAKMSDDDRIVSLYVVNFGKAEKQKSFSFAGFSPGNEATVTQLGPYLLDARNNGENPEYISPKTEKMKMKSSGFAHSFPGYSFTVIRLEKKSDT
ncbi:MAG TPA: alpha-L-arabinofuranosidase C-terminal domain-containing protein [Bacteroidales bacterium]|nr:alpha-L-arabinofuranosidase C-terminal domain-containing protein [Bacteroidales bacterium]